VTSDADDLAAIAGELYALDLDAFTARRNARAKELRADRPLSDAVGALPKPSAAAWLVNQLVRSRPDEVGAALGLGKAFRAAQAGFDRDALRELGKERRVALSDVAEAAREVAAERGRPFSAALGDEVEQSVLAGIADAAAAEAIGSGRLVRSLITVGAEPVDLEGAVAAPGNELVARSRPRTADAPRAPREDRTARIRAEIEEARAGAEEARAAADDAGRVLDDAVTHHEELARERDDALAEYERLERAVGDAERQRREAIRERDRAIRRREGAERVLARVEARLEADG
jgi:hypothetical protein